jgi:membrane-bound metal-dependent hydrolase YbcI (DUF457 family)
MFIGHFAVGFASKRVAPKAGLGPLLAAPLLLDLLFPIFLILGWERASIVPGITAMNPLNLEHLPISHSLVTTVGWGVLLGALYWWRTRYVRGAVVIAAGVLSHWVLDFVTHIPDLPLWPGGPKVGLGLWNSIAGTVVVESMMFGAAVWALHHEHPRARQNRAVRVVVAGGAPCVPVCEHVVHTTSQRRCDAMGGALGMAVPALGLVA